MGRAQVGVGVMSWFSFVSLAGFLIIFFVWTLVFGRRRTSATYRAFLVFMSVVALWTWLDFVSWLPLADRPAGWMLKVSPPHRCRCFE